MATTSDLPSTALHDASVPTSMGERIRIERERLGFTQVEMAKRCGVSRFSQSNFEGDINVPGGAYLREAHFIGADIVYILVGQVSRNRPYAATPPRRGRPAGRKRVGSA